MTVDAAPRSAAGTVLPIGGFDVRSLSRDALADELLGVIADGGRCRVCFANSNFVVQCQPLAQRLRAPQVCIVNDGIAMDIAALLVHRQRFADNLNGTDFVPFLCTRSAQPLRVFLLGGASGVAQRAAAALAARTGAVIAGTCDGFAQRAAAGAGLVDTINASKADVLLVAMGNPLQETWMLDHDAALDVPVSFGVGALFDFLCGDARRAPPLVRRLRLEWLFRLCQEPTRLLRRYTLDLFVFLRLCLRSGSR